MRISDFEPMVADFGLAKQVGDGASASAATHWASQTQSGAILGTPSYMAPEQAGANRKAVGPAADTYALGAILYELLTGRPPFEAATPLDTVLKLLSEELTPPRSLAPGLPRDLETVCLKCLAKEPGKRYASAAELADDLERSCVASRCGPGVPVRSNGRVDGCDADRSRLSVCCCWWPRWCGVQCVTVRACTAKR